MSYEKPKAPQPKPEQAREAASTGERAVAPGKQARATGRPAQPGSAPPPVQQKSGAGAGAPRKSNAALTTQWLDTAMRPDLYPPPVQHAQGDGALGTDDVHGLAAQGIAGPATALPHMEQIQRSFRSDGARRRRIERAGAGAADVDPGGLARGRVRLGHGR